MGFRIGVDIGGTFTDCCVVDNAGLRTTAKSLTTHGDLTDGVLAAVGVAAAELDRSPRDLLAATTLFVHGTTVATNAALVRSGARTGLLTTAGHEDAIIIGKVFAKRAGLPQREIVHASRLNKPEPIVPRPLIRGLVERIDVAGDVLAPLRDDDVLRAIDELVALDVEAVAVSLLWSPVNSVHERRVAELLERRAPQLYRSLSHEIAPVIGEYERTATTALNAYVGPEVATYLSDLERRLAEAGLPGSLLIMQASGGLTSVGHAASRPIEILDSGPTGGILGCRHYGARYGERHLICTDVGGTSFDVGLVLDGEAQLDPEPVVSQYTLRVPKIAVRSIGAGGGSMAWVDEGGLLRVGPRSAGSRPGPACYGLGGTEATVTDADLVLGYLDPDAFLGGRMTLSRDAALAALGALGGLLGMEPEEVAVGIFHIVNAHMADLIRTTTIERGHDPRDCVLLAYGGAAPTHAAFYGDEIGALSILVLAGSSVFSAEGMLTCDVAHVAQASRQLRSPFDGPTIEAFEEQFGHLERQLLRQFAAEGTPAAEVSLQRSLGLRYRHQVHTVDVEIDPGPPGVDAAEQMRRRFRERYSRIYGDGALLRDGALEADLHRVTGTRGLAPPPFAHAAPAPGGAARALTGRRRAHLGTAGFAEVDVYDGHALSPGDELPGPVIIQRMGDSVVVPAGYRASVDELLSLRLRRTDDAVEVRP